MDIFQNIKLWLYEALLDTYRYIDVDNIFSISDFDLDSIQVEIPKETVNGDFSTNIAMILASKLKTHPQKIANQIVDTLIKKNHKEIKKIDISQSGGFINIFLQPKIWADALLSLSYIPTSIYGHNKIGAGKKVNIEFVSVNPTGPMHIGHGRGAVYGDVLANLLQFCGYEVIREYYINDAGNQITILAHSLLIRYKQLLGQKIELPERSYHGSYLIELAKLLIATHGDSLIQLNLEEQLAILGPFSIRYMMDMIKNELALFGVYHDVFISEKDDIIKTNKVEESLSQLSEKGLTYKGILSQPKGEYGDITQQDTGEQLIFSSTKFGDDSDRPLIKANGEYTYFAADLAYQYHKIQRNFDQLIMVLGSDHIGYKKRLQAAVQALTDTKQIDFEILLCQMVKVSYGGKSSTMSKRDGTFIPLAKALQELGADILRFSMLWRRIDSPLEIDFEKAKEQSRENPLFYVQYAHTRAVSLINKAHRENICLPSEINITIPSTINNKVAPMYLYNPQEQIDYTLLPQNSKYLIQQILYFPILIENAAIKYEPHKLTYYIYNLASLFHNLWNQGQEDSGTRFITNCKKTSRANIGLAYHTARTIGVALSIIGIIPMLLM